MTKRIGFGLLELIFAVGLVALLAGGGFYAKEIAQRQSAVEVGNSAINQAKELQQTLNKRAEDQARELENLGAPAQPAATPTLAPSTADWKTYRNEQYGFEFKYPPDWQIELDDRVSRVMAVGPDRGTGSFNAQADFGVDFGRESSASDIKKFSIAQRLNNYFGYDFLGTMVRESSSVIIDGLPAIFVVPQEGLRTSRYWYVFADKGVYTVFYTVDSKEGSRVNPEILSTLKFTK